MTGLRLTRMAWVALFVCAGAPLGPVLGAEDKPGFRVGPPADWVKMLDVAVPAEIPQLQVSEGVYYLLLDQQAHAGRQEHYRRVVKKFLAEDGVPDAALKRVRVPVGLDLGARTAPEIALAIRRAGATVFQGKTRCDQIARPLHELVAYLGRDNLFPSGVILLTGTGIVPPDDFCLQADDWVEITIERIGTLPNRVESSMARRRGNPTWPQQRSGQVGNPRRPCATVDDVSGRHLQRRGS